MFPQLIAGPIVRYQDVNNEIDNRNVTFEMFANGLRRFIIGLSKKVIIANNLGELCNIYLNLGDKSVLLLGYLQLVICYKFILIFQVILI